MSPIVLGIADGTAFFIGLLLVAAVMVLLLRVRARLARSVLNVLVALGMILVVISATPLPVWAYVSWGTAALAALILSRPAPRPNRAGPICCGLLLIASAALFAAELPHRFTPRIPVSKGLVVYVLGDSISAGMGTTDRCWPDVLTDRPDVRVINLAQPGATVESAFLQARGIVESNALVILEIGGNDLLSGTPVAVFREQLDRLVSGIRSGGHPVLLFEIPLFPFQNDYGRAQREIAKACGAAMLPKRFFTHVLGMQNATLDGLHLSQAGHDALAGIISGILTTEREPCGDP